MAVLLGQSASDFAERKAVAREVVTRSRKRCRVCRKMVEVGDRAILTDDRFADAHIGRTSGAMTTVVRGAWHLTHVECPEGC